MTAPSAEQVIERGLAAASLLSDYTFTNVIKSLAVECFATFTETKPDQKQVREDAYNLYSGLKAIEDELTARIQAKDAEVSRIDAALEDHDDLDEPFIIQGNNDQ
jgi:hypothetical protein